MGHLDLTGMGVALITPFQTNGNVDYDALSRVMDFQMQSGTDYFVVLGTTAETPTLSITEQKEIIRFAVDKIEGKLPLVLGISGNDTKIVTERLKNEDLKGIDAVLSAVPYYNKPAQEGIYRHYEAISQASPLPIIIYNVPGRTGVNMTAETTLRIARDFKNVVATKEASGNIAQIGSIIKNKPDGFHVISGDDGLTFPLITLGATGVISVAGNAFPKECAKMTHLALSGDFASALKIHYDLDEIFELLFVDGSPAGVKSLLHLMGFIENVVRLPLVPVRASTCEKLREELARLSSRV